MAAEAREDGATAIAAVGTMGMRTARNSQQFIDAVQQRCGVTIEVISGEEEGRLAYLAVKSGLGYVLWDAYYVGRMDVVLADMASIGILGFLSDRLLLLLAARVLHWKQV
jgi:hypothetical protein